MKLTQDNIQHYFSLPTLERTTALLGKNPYDFVNRNSDTLLITIGDSWTWGADLTKVKFNGCHIDKLSDDQYRLLTVFGGVLSNKLGSDFLNLGESGSGNYYILEKLKELENIVKDLEYQRIIVICILTEVARDFDSSYDRKVNYYKWLTDNTNYNQLLEFINSNISRQIVDLDLPVELYFSTNFVDPIGFDCLQDKFLSQTWLQTWCKHKNLDYTDTCYLVSPWVFEKLENIFTINPKLDRIKYLEWSTQALELANKRAALCKKDNVNFGQLLHPLAEGHQIWAEYIYDSIL